MSTQQFWKPAFGLLENEHDPLLPHNLVGLSSIFNPGFAHNFYSELVFFAVLSDENGSEFALTDFLKDFIVSFVVHRRVGNAD
jgi:hypothetical protein